MDSLNNTIMEVISSEGVKKCSLLGYFNNLLSKTKLNSDDMVLVVKTILDNVKVHSDLLMLIYCLNNGVDPNMYIMSDIGNCHIVLYCKIKNWSDKLFFICFSILVLKGSDFTLNSFKKEDKKANSKGNNVRFADDFDKDLVDAFGRDKDAPVDNDYKIETVNQWLKYNNINYPTISSELIKLINNTSIKDGVKDILAVYLNISEININETDDLVSYYIMSRNSDFLHLIHTQEIANKCMILCDEACFSLGIETILHNYLPSYYMFSFWLSQYTSLIKNSDVNEDKIEYFKTEMENIFKMTVESGYQMDLYQLNELNYVNGEFSVQLSDDYKKPLWEKVCNTDIEFPDDIKNTSIYLGLSSTMKKKDVCKQFMSITSSDFETIKNNIRKRNTNEMDKLDFVTDSSHNICYNLDSFDKDPMTYSEQSLAYYKDNSGHTWCYLSNSFENIVKNKKNIVTNEDLPPEFVFEIEEKMRVAKFFGISLEPQNLLDLIQNLKKDDVISNDESDIIINSIDMIFGLKGFKKEDITDVITLGKYVKAFNIIGEDLYSVLPIYDESLTLYNHTKYMSTILQKSILCRFLRDIIKKSIDNATRFFKYLK